jgi:hypothetical protein
MVRGVSKLLGDVSWLANVGSVFLLGGCSRRSSVYVIGKAFPQ